MDSSKENVLVTGSSGLLGSAVVRALAGRFNVIGYDREGPPYPPADADCVFVDLTSDESVQNAFTHVRQDYGTRLASVVHLAAYYDFSGAPSALYDAVTVGGTERILRELADFEVGQLLFSSTMLVHAPCRPGERIDENWPLEPRWEYPSSKLRTENLLRQKHGRTPLLIHRIAGVYDDGCHSIPLSHQIQRIYERRMTGQVFPGDPRRGQAFVHLDDVVGALVLSVDRRGAMPPEETLLIGEAQTMSYEDLQAELGKLLHGEAWPARPIPKPLAKAGAWLMDRVGDPFIKPWMIDLADDHYELSVGRAERALGWRPSRKLRDTLPRMVEALLSDPAGWYREHHLKIPGWLRKKAA